MPSEKLTDAFIRNLTFAKALRDVHKAAVARWENACEKTKKGEPLPAKPAKPNSEKLKQVAYLDTRDRGLAVTLIVSSGGTKAFRVLTYRNGKPRSIKLGTYPQMSVPGTKPARISTTPSGSRPRPRPAHSRTLRSSGSNATWTRTSSAPRAKSSAA